MTDFSFILLYVENPPESAKFYADLLGRPPVEVSPTFAMLPLRDGVMLGLWQRSGVKPEAHSGAGGSEIAFTVADAAAVHTAYQDWSGRGLTIVQAPVQMDFGSTFVAIDLDGHRLRVLAPEQA